MKANKIFILIALLTLLFTGCVSGPAGIKGKTKDGFSYVNTGDYIVITKYNGKPNDVIIPETIEGLPVTEIGAHAFEYTFRSITSVVFPDSITIIRNYAFSSNIRLSRVRLPAHITEIEGTFNSHVETIEVTGELDTSVSWSDAFSNEFIGWYVANEKKPGVYTLKLDNNRFCWYYEGTCLYPHNSTKWAVLKADSGVIPVMINGEPARNYRINEGEMSVFNNKNDIKYLMPPGPAILEFQYDEGPGGYSSNDTSFMRITAVPGRTYEVWANLVIDGNRRGRVEFMMLE